MFWIILCCPFCKTAFQFNTLKGLATARCNIQTHVSWDSTIPNDMQDSSECLPARSFVLLSFGSSSYPLLHTAHLDTIPHSWFPPTQRPRLAPPCAELVGSREFLLSLHTTQPRRVSAVPMASHHSSTANMPQAAGRFAVTCD